MHGKLNVTESTCPTQPQGPCTPPHIQRQAAAVLPLCYGTTCPHQHRSALSALPYCLPRMARTSPQLTMMCGILRESEGVVALPLAPMFALPTVGVLLCAGLAEVAVLLVASREPNGSKSHRYVACTTRR